MKVEVPKIENGDLVVTQAGDNRVYYLMVSDKQGYRLFPIPSISGGVQLGGWHSMGADADDMGRPIVAIYRERCQPISNTRIGLILREDYRKFAGKEAGVPEELFWEKPTDYHEYTVKQLEERLGEHIKIVGEHNDHQEG